MCDHAGERWVLSPRNPNYLVSDHGRVRRIGGRILRPQRNTRGYHKVHLGAGMQQLLHVVVAEAFHGRRPAGHDVDHIDFNRHNNHADNLRWLPSPDNRVRWAHRTNDGRNVWLTPDDLPDDVTPEDNRPITAAEWAEFAAEAQAAGW